MNPLTLVPAKRQDNESIVDALEELLEMAREGDVCGLHAVIEYKDELVYKRVGLPYLKCLGLLSRAMHSLNKDWDESK